MTTTHIMEPEIRRIVDAHLHHLVLDGKRATTIRGREHALRFAHAHLPGGLLSDADEIAVWLAGYESHKTRSHYDYHIRQFHRWAHDEGALEGPDPMAALKPPRVRKGRPRPASDAQVERIMTTAEEPFRTWATLSAYEGLRAFEVAALHRRHVTDTEFTIVDGKGGKPAVLPTHEAVWEAIEPLPPGPIARKADGSQRSGDELASRFGEYCRLALGLRGVALHNLRHWCGTTLLRATGNLRYVQEYLRHESPATTAIYTLVTLDEVRDAARTLPKFR